MLTKNHMRYTALGYIALIFFLAAILLDFSVFSVWVCTGAMIVCFGVALCFYGKTIYTLTHFADIPRLLVPLSLLLHILSVVAVVFQIMNVAFLTNYPSIQLYFTSLVLRVAFGIARFDHEAKEICIKLDTDRTCLHAETM